MREMKDSGIEWIGKIPASWNSHPLYYFFDERKNRNFDLKERNLLSLSYGNIIKKDINTTGGLLPSSFNTYNIVKYLDIIIRPTDLQNDKKSLRTGLVKEKKGIITSAYIALKPREKVFSHYFHYLLHSYDVMKVFYNMGNGVRQGLNYSEFSKLMLITPPFEEQHKIADFLDQKCSEIDALAADIQTQIETLEEYKKSVITEAVTKGLNPDAEMKDSGIEWIGKIPQTWIIKKIRYVTKSISDIDHYMPSDSDDEDSIPYLMISDLKDKTSEVDFEHCKQVSHIDYKQLSSKIKNQIDDVILARYATIGTVTYVDTNSNFLVSYACLTIKTHKNMYGKFLFYYFKSKSFLEDVSQYINSNTQGNVGKESLARTQIVVPPIIEQHQIAEFLDQKCSDIDKTISEKQKQLETLSDYKKSLIYECVTGKREIA